MDVLIHGANILFLLSYSVRDILVLRVLTVVAIALIVPYYVAAGPLWPPIAWNVVFVAINCVQVWRLVLERRPVRLDPDARLLHAMVFSKLSPRQLVKLLAIASWQAADRGSVLVRAGAPLDRLSVVASGSVRVTEDDRVLVELVAGRFVGEMSYLTGKTPSVSVVAGEGCRCVHWPAATLKTFLADHPDIRAIVQDVLGADLAHKLRGDTVSRTTG